MSNEDHKLAESPSSALTNEHAAVVALARDASLEMSVHDIPQLEPSRAHLPPGMRMYVSHLPAQSWNDALTTCIAAHQAGWAPIPHIPVRCIEDRASFDHFLRRCVADANVQEALIIAGDYASSVGPYKNAMDLLRSGVLQEAGIRRVSVAGHPEGHPKVPDSELRRAEEDKIRFALEHDFHLTFLTQFFFDAAPFIAWRRELSVDDRIRVVAGLAGPAKLSTLIRFAAKCGVGASLRALTQRPSSISQLVADRGPESLVRAIARAGFETKSGIHLFSFGGLVRTCAWLNAVRAGRFNLDDNDSFAVSD